MGVIITNTPRQLKSALGSFLVASRSECGVWRPRFACCNGPKLTGSLGIIGAWPTHSVLPFRAKPELIHRKGSKMPSVRGSHVDVNSLLLCGLSFSLSPFTPQLQPPIRPPVVHVSYSAHMAGLQGALPLPFLTFCCVFLPDFRGLPLPRGTALSASALCYQVIL